jgi:hypothetical protein
MNEESIVKFIYNKLKKGESKEDCLKLNFIKELPPETFNLLFEKAKRLKINERNNELKEEKKKTSKTFVVRIPLSLYERFDRAYRQQIAITPMKYNQSKYVKELLELSLKYKYKKWGFNWETNE